MTVNFSNEAREIIERIQTTNDNLFVTGKAGTGKSTLLKYLIETNNEYVVVAPTGIAAINVNGDTIHSFFKLKPGFELDEAKHMRITNQMVAQYKSLKTLIIDEISMVRADLLDAINVLLQRIKNNNAYFGGVRVLFFGDLFQLPPVLINEDKKYFLEKYTAPYFFAATLFKPTDLFTPPFEISICELKKIYRQSDPTFTDILNAIRKDQVNDAQLETLNKQVNHRPKNEDFDISLVTTNAIANRINSSELNKINAPIYTYNATATGAIGNLQPNDTQISIKKDAQIMFVTNDPEKRWVNGTIGKVLDITIISNNRETRNNFILKVILNNGKIVEVKPYTWEISKYVFKNGRFVREQIGVFTQIPIKLAWAITIHKSQGKTFESISVDLGNGSFAHGQTYVALSRCKTLEKISLSRPITHQDIILDPTVVSFIE